MGNVRVDIASGQSSPSVFVSAAPSVVGDSRGNDIPDVGDVRGVDSGDDKDLTTFPNSPMSPILPRARSLLDTHRQLINALNEVPQYAVDLEPSVADFPTSDSASGQSRDPEIGDEVARQTLNYSEVQAVDEPAYVSIYPSLSRELRELTASNILPYRLRSSNPGPGNLGQ